MIYPATSRMAGQGATYRREPGWDHRALVVILGGADNLPDTTMMIGSSAMPVAERAFRAVEAPRRRILAISETGCGDFSRSAHPRGRYSPAVAVRV